MTKIWLVLLAVLAMLGVFVWAVDFVTLQGERTIYTATCNGGTWLESGCTGQLAAAERYRFRALKSKDEVVFWIAGSAQPSGKLTPCLVQDGRNWKCKENAGTSGAITLEMREGFAVADPATNARPFHAVPKWKWFLLRYGLS